MHGFRLRELLGACSCTTGSYCTNNCIKEVPWRNHLQHCPSQIGRHHGPRLRGHEPIITRSGWQAVVMMSLDDFKALEETAYLLRSPRNAQRLLESIAALESGKDKVRSLAK